MNIILSVCICLLPSQVMAEDDICDILPSCEDLGYNISEFSKCAGFSAIPCPFNPQKYFCNKPKCLSSASQIYDVLKGECVGGTEYCAEREKTYDASTNKCVPCSSGYMFNKDKKECTEICAFNNYSTTIQTDNICTTVQVNNKTCYKCVPSNCGTGYLKSTGAKTVYDLSGKAFAVKQKDEYQEDKYYKPITYRAGGIPYEGLADAVASGLVAPKKASVSAINAVMGYGSGQTYWLEEGCQGVTDGTYDGHYVANVSGTNSACKSNSSGTSFVIALKDCTDDCPYKATLASCDSTKYICEYEDCSGKWFNKGCNTDYYNKYAKSVASSSYDCPSGTAIQKCNLNALRYRCVACEDAYVYGKTQKKARLNYKISGGLATGERLQAEIYIYNKCGGYITGIFGELKTNGSIESDGYLNTSGDYRVKVDIVPDGNVTLNSIQYNILEIKGHDYADYASFPGPSQPIDVSLGTGEELLIELEANVY